MEERSLGARRTEVRLSSSSLCEDDMFSMCLFPETKDMHVRFTGKSKSYLGVLMIVCLYMSMYV